MTAGSATLTAPTSSSGRIQSLDGLRAISIVLVLLGHLGGTRGFPVPDSIMRFASVGVTGVRVFFVISGFLITSILLAEHDRTGTVSLKKFYYRRTLRIFPTYYAFICGALLLSWWGAGDGSRHVFLTAATYTSNYVGDRGWLLGHTWSLAVEEQFYLLWPAVVLLLRPKRALWWAIIAVLCAPIFRIIAWQVGDPWRLLIGTSFETTMDSIAMGALLAGYRAGLIRIPGLSRLLCGRYVWLAGMLILSIASLDRPRTQALAGITISNLSIALVVDHAVRSRASAWVRFLNWSPVVFIGTISYSLYLWQQPFLNRTSDGWWAAFPVNVLLALTAALASYYVVERPFLRLRERLEPRVLGTVRKPS